VDFARAAKGDPKKRFSQKQSGQLIERVGHFGAKDEERCDHQIEAEMHDGF
jgi:hypothetical protein